MHAGISCLRLSEAPPYTTAPRSRFEPTSIVSAVAAICRGRLCIGAALYVAPLCPAGHLPHMGGDRLSSAPVLFWKRFRLAKSKRPADLPPSGGDVRQDRGGRDRTQAGRNHTPPNFTFLH